MKPGGEHFKELKDLTNLALVGTQITDSALKYIEGLTSLTRPNVAHTKTSDTGMKHLKGLENLTILNIHRTHVSDVGLQDLKLLTQLTVLLLSETKVTAEGIVDLQPRTMSFKGAAQTLEAFQPLIAYIGGRSHQLREQLFQELLDAIATHRVANRPDRLEPRKKKRRRMPYDLLMKRRAEAKRDILKGVSKN